MSRLSAIFDQAGKCFIPFVTAGHPSLEQTEEIVLGMVRAGAHIVEIGIPFSDPIADGPIIQKSSHSALAHRYTIDDYLGLIARIRQQSDAGLIFMSYLNPLQRYGLARLDQEAEKAGLDGVLISDLTPEEYSRMDSFQSLGTVFLAAPTSSDERLDRICAVSSGFLYLVARTGVTGRHTQIDSRTLGALRRIRNRTQLPVVLGFGIDSRDAVQRVWDVADGAVVGSAIVKLIEKEKENNKLPGLVAEFVSELIP